MTHYDARDSKILHSAWSELGETQAIDEFLESVSILKPHQKHKIIEQALVLIEQLYAHLPLKRARHAIRPLQQLQLLRQKVEELQDSSFHAEMLNIFKGLRDAHTNYGLPSPYSAQIAFLPFLLEDFQEDGEHRFLVTRLLFGFRHSRFKPGVEVTHWNGTPIKRAVLTHADREEGSNPPARFAFGLASMTVRSLGQSLPPDEEWVLVTFCDGDKSHEIIFPWRLWNTAADPRPNLAQVEVEPNQCNLASASLNLRVQQMHQARKYLFVRSKNDAAERISPVASAIQAAEFPIGEQDLTEINVAEVDLDTESLLPSIFEFAFPEVDGERYGYIRIRTFNHAVAEFINEFLRILDLMPRQGLILDVRSNGGGVILNGELLLQFLTPRSIEPEPAQFINTDLTQKLCSIPESGFDQAAAERLGLSLAELQSLRGLRAEFASIWGPSIAQSVQTGAVYSRGFPITDPELANRFGQQYHGPVVLITDAQCYSTTDIFAAGFQDHNIGLILGIDNNTGAGGANVFGHGELLVPLLHDDDSPLIQALPEQTTMRVSIRRTLRVGPNMGQPLEDLGVKPDVLHAMTRDDLLNGNRDLIARAIALLASQRSYQLDIQQASLDDDSLLTVSIRTQNLDRVDCFVDDRPIDTFDLEDGEQEFDLAVSDTAFELKLNGYVEGEFVAARKLFLNFA